MIEAVSAVSSSQQENSYHALSAPDYANCLNVGQLEKGKLEV
jgi:hypothetical protein